MLNKMTIEGLRGFAIARDIGLAIPNGQPGSGLTLLTGPNNSGKSTIIEALKVLSSIHQNPSFHVGMRNDATDSVIIKYLIDSNIEEVVSSRPASSETVSTRCSDLAPYVVPSRRRFSPHFGKSASTSRTAYATQFGSYQEIREQALTGFEGRLFELERNHVAFNTLLKQVIPEFMDWSIDQNETGHYFIKLKSSSKSHSLGGSGDGIVSVFVIVAALFDSQEGDVIAIDEPELSLHPTIQKRLAAIIKQFSANRQIVVSTHSPYFVDPGSIAEGAEIVRTWDRGDAIEVYQLSVSTSEHLKKLLTPNGNNPHVFGLDAREIFFSDDPVLVFEGQEDVVFWPQVVTSKPELAKISTYGWGAGGAANMINVIGVLKTLGFQKVAGVLDNNRPEDLDELRSTFPEYHFMEIPAPDIRTKPPVMARSQVTGLLDGNCNVRSELVAELVDRLGELAEYLAT